MSVPRLSIFRRLLVQRTSRRHRAAWLNVAAAWLVVLLQRTPVARLAGSAAGFSAAPSRIVSLLRSFTVSTAALGTVHSLAGATQFVISSTAVSAAVGTAITPVAFTVTGAAIPAGSFRITGTLPPGLTIANMNASGLLNGSAGTISGTPTTAGSYTISVLAYERISGAGDTFGPATIRFTITGPAPSAPVIGTQPVGQNAVSGATVTLSVTVSGAPAPTYQWQKDSSVIPGATNSTLTLSNLQPVDAGAYSVVVTNSGGSVTSSTAALSVTSPGPVLSAQPQSQQLTLGTDATLSVAAVGSGLTYQWKKDGVALPGATLPNLALTNASTDTMGFYRVTVFSASGSTESSVATVTVATGGPSRLVNVSTRGYVPAGGALTPGFVLLGTSPKSVLIRGVGPTLGTFGVTGSLADPTMDVIPLGSSTALISNDNWGGASSMQTAFSRVGAFPLAASSSADASVETSLPANGASGYTVRITSRNADAAGIALAEVYDEDAITSPGRLVNVSTSGFVGTGEQALVPGFFIGGTGPKQLLIRAVGPGLTPFGVSGVLSNPQLSIVPLGKDFAIAGNDNWGGATALQNAFTQAAAFPLSAASLDAAVLIQLPPGGYTVVVSGVGGTTGTALVEIYDLDP